MNILPSKYEFEQIEAIATRAVALAAEFGVKYQKLDCILDLSAAHKEVCLRLVDLLNADNGNFGHDVFGIRQHMNRVTGKLEDCFMPRFAFHDIAEQPEPDDRDICDPIADQRMDAADVERLS